MIQHITIRLSEQDMTRLCQLASQERRAPQEQAAYMLSHALHGNDTADLCHRVEQLEQAVDILTTLYLPAGTEPSLLGSDKSQ